MRRGLVVLACLGVLVFAGAGTALARGPHHRPPGVHHDHGYGYGHGYRGAPWYTGYHSSFGAHCAPRPRVVVYPAYPVYEPVYTPYSQLGFGIAGRNFSFWLQQ
ncbi:MAG: hypothetical protein WD063_15495 [Pirellulales bacterium]